MNRLQVRQKELPLSVRIEVMVYLVMNKPFIEFMGKLSNVEVVALQKFVWDKTVEIGLRLKGKSFTRKDITKRMIPTPTYQRQQKCSERVYYCKGVMCIHSNPECARNKIHGHLSAMQGAVQQWLEETEPPAVRK
ncbi:MAG TPA: hypothetical protein ENH29_10560 [Bacteroidetes bacterium]|nr:hypothetical protein [Bacteroidota bacterium]